MEPRIPFSLSVSFVALSATRARNWGAPSRYRFFTPKPRFRAAWSVLPIVVSMICAGCESRGNSTIAKLNGQIIVEVSKVPDAAARNELLGSVGVLQAIFGDSQEGFNAINKINDARGREHALFSLAVSQMGIAKLKAGEGDYGAGRKAISLARQAVQDITPKGHGADAMIISAIKETSPEAWEAEARLRAEDRAAALAALKIADPRKKATTLAGIAETQAKEGEISAAIDTAKHIESKGPKWKALQAIAIAQSRAGDIAGGTKTIQQIEEIVNASAANDPKREFYFSRPSALALAALASAQSKAGDTEGAKRSLSEAQEVVGEMQTYRVSSLLRDMTRTQLESQDQASAKQTFAFWENLLQKRQQDSKQPFVLNQSYKDLSKALAEAGYLEDAARIAGSTGQPTGPAKLPPKSRTANPSDGAGHPSGAEGASSREGTAKIKYDEDAIAAIIRQQLSRGDTKGALETLDKIADSARGMHLRYDIVDALLKADDYDAVLKVAEKISDPNTRFWLLIRGNVVSRVPGALAAALETAHQIPDMPGMKNGQASDNALRWVVQAQARAGDLEQARETLKAIASKEERTIAIESIAAVEAEAKGSGFAARSAGQPNKRATAAAKPRGKAPSPKVQGLLSSFEALPTISDWKGSEPLQVQLWETLTVQLSDGQIEDAQVMLRNLLQLAAGR